MLKNKTENFVAGSIANNRSAWKELTTDRWILDVVSGYRLEFPSRPEQNYRPHPMKLLHIDKLALAKALEDLLDYGVIPLFS